jgi:hypothetical protein
MSRLKTLLKKRSAGASKSLKPQIPRPTKVFYVPVADFDTLHTQGMIGRLRPIYFRGVKLGDVVIIRIKEESYTPGKFIIARLMVDSKYPNMRMYAH